MESRIVERGGVQGVEVGDGSRERSEQSSRRKGLRASAA